MTAPLDARPTAVYQICDVAGTIIYVGCSYDPRHRVGHHRRSAPWGHEIASVDVEWYEDRTTALAHERASIFDLNPRHNRQQLVGPVPVRSPRTKPTFDIGSTRASARAALIELCQRMGITAADLEGSAA